MTTIGTAVLQIIPSLKGVTDAIEKQIDGKVVEVKVAPKVDQPAAKKAGKDAGEAIAKETKDAVKKADVGKTVGDEVTNSVKQSTTGKDVAKIIVDGVADGVKQEMRAGAGSVGQVVVDGIAEGVKQGIDGEGIGGQVVDAISGGIQTQNLGGKIKDAVLPTITQIGTNIRSSAAEWSSSIANSLRSGDIQGAASSLAATVQNTTDTIAGIGSAFGANTEDIQNIGTDVATALQRVGDTAGTTKDQVNNVLTPMQTLGELAGPDSKLYKASSNLPLIGAIVASVPALQEASNQLEGIVQKYTGLNIPLSATSWFREVTDNGKIFNSAEQNARDKLAAAQAAHEANAAPVTRDPGLLPTQHGRAAGGPITGPGGPTSDSIPIWASNGEFVVNAAAAQKNLPLLEHINSGNMRSFAGGGLVAGDEQLRQIIMDRFGISNIGGYRPADKYGEHSTGRALDVMVGANRGKGDAVKDFALSNASAIDLKWVIWRQHLYYPGGGGYDMEDRGDPTQNHMDHVHIFSGTGITNGLRGALAGGPGAGTGTTGGIPVVGGPGAEDTTSSDQTVTKASASSGGAGQLPSSLSGLSGFGLDALGAGEGKTGSGSDLGLFGKAAGSAVSGQVSSALGVLGVNDAPGWLKGASMLLGGIKVADKSGNTLFDGSNPLGSFGHSAPLSASPTAGGTPAPDNVHGSRANQAPGPTYNTVINARDAEDALAKWQQKQNELTASKLSRF